MVVMAREKDVVRPVPNISNGTGFIVHAVTVKQESDHAIAKFVQIGYTKGYEIYLSMCYLQKGI